MLEYVEAAILALGVVALIACVLAAHRNRGIRAWLSLPRPHAPTVGILDALLPPVCYLFTTALFMQLAISLGLGPLPASSNPNTASATTSAPTVPTTAIAAEPDSTAKPNAMFVVSQVAAQLIAIAIVIALVRGVYAGRLRWWGLRFDRVRQDAAVAATGYFASWPLILGTAVLTTELLVRLVPGFSPQEHTALQTLSDPAMPAWGRWLTYLSAALLAPIAEELYFRGMLMPVIAARTGSAWIGIVVTGVLFGFIHAEQQNIPALALFGVVLGFVYARTGSLVAAILLHALFNVKTLILAAFVGRG